MLLGNSPAKIDEKGRIKIPTAFRNELEEKFGREFFVTSTDGRFVQIYPLPVWLELLERVSKMSSLHPAATRFRNTVNYFGAVATMDRQGRVLIQPLLRERARMNGEVAVLANEDHLEVWNREVFEQKLLAEPLTEKDLREISSPE